LATSLQITKLETRTLRALGSWNQDMQAEKVFTPGRHLRLERKGIEKKNDVSKTLCDV
jgi:hypothetical protein